MNRLSLVDEPEPPEGASHDEDEQEQAEHQDGGSQKMAAPSKAVNVVLNHPTLPILLTGHADKKVRFWDVQNGAFSSTLLAHTDEVTSISIDSTGLYLLSGSHDCSWRIWNLETKLCSQMTSSRKDGRTSPAEGAGGEEEEVGCVEGAWLREGEGPEDPPEGVEEEGEETVSCFDPSEAAETVPSSDVGEGEGPSEEEEGAEGGASTAQPIGAKHQPARNKSEGEGTAEAKACSPMSRLAAKRLAGRGTGTRGRGRGLVSRLGGGAASGRRLSLTNRLAGSARLTNALALKKLQQAKRTLQLARKGRISKGGITTEALRASAARKGKLTVNALSTKKVALAVRGGRGSLAGARGAAARGKGARGALSRLPNAAVQLAILKKQLLEAKLEHAPSGRGIRGRGAVKLNRPPRAAFSSMVADQEMSSRRPSNLTISVSNPGALGKPIKLRRPNQEAEAVMAVAPVREEPVYHVQKLNTQLQREIARLQGKDGQGAGARSGLSNTASSLLSPSALAKYRPLALSSAMTMTERLSKNSRTIIT
ncbi:unnamed protein product [Cyprideis torosa]|uniref:Uncharacterized protein n=1 Tax=Cyprideis torosa TaxID=163714 RepID=A0A7R8ZL93_9CRUS|nr:unnamed protein product [Cyprideis torosa]CAG0891294.1 unnamed protein product [Cyprideis torosa]